MCLCVNVCLCVICSLSDECLCVICASVYDTCVPVCNVSYAEISGHQESDGVQKDIL